jgi:hypothetical protein
MKRLSQGSKPDLVNNPPHYNQGDIECIDAIASALGPIGFHAYCRGNMLKYLWRAELKGGKEDLRKAHWYLHRILEQTEEPNDIP